MKAWYVLALIGLVSASTPCLAESLYRVDTNITSNIARIGDKIEIDLCLINLSNKAVLIWDTGDQAELDYKVNLVRSDGVVLQRVVQPSRIGNARHTELEPNETHVEKLDLGKLFNISEPGVYTFSASRGGPDGSIIQSTPVEISISK